MHILPQLRKLERKYQNELQVIGVHSAKFPSERETANLRKAVLRYRIEHPVVNDAQFDIWMQYANRAWPTIVFIDPQGKVIGKHEGEFTATDLDRVLARMIQEFDGLGLLDRRPLEFRREQERESPLSFPGKVLADAASNRLFIADSNHNRIVVTDLSGRVRAVIGSGEEGLMDGDFEAAQFNQPQGMALVDDALYVADTENHAIRRVDLSRRTVETVAGTGEQAMMAFAGGPANSTPLSSPWDVAAANGRLYVAMAGVHQLWALDLQHGTVYPFAGSGHEGLADGPLDQAWLAQPSGISADGNRLYFADSETSSIRIADTSHDGRVSTIVGQDLFVFGDVDGSGDEVRLQHPLGVDHHDGIIYVADSYNHKIKQVFPRTRSAATFLGTGEAGYRDGAGAAALFHEPGGLSVADGKLYIADTNNHLVRVADLTTREVTTLDLTGLE